MTTNRADSTPATRDPEADATLALLDRAMALIAEADEATSRELRDRADAAILLARRKGLDDVQRRAAELKLRTEARLGEIVPPPKTRAEVSRLGVEARAGHTDDREPAVRGPTDAERMDMDRCRKVAGVKDHIGAYLDYVKAAGEDPSRAGLLKWVEATTKQNRKYQVTQEQNPSPASRTTLDTTGKVVPTAPAAMEGAATDPAAMAGKLKINNRPKDQPARPAPIKRDVFVAAKWRTVAKAVQGARDGWAREIPVRQAPEGKEDLRETYHRDLLRLLDEWLYIANEAIEMEPTLVEGYAKERARAQVSA